MFTSSRHCHADDGSQGLEGRCWGEVALAGHVRGLELARHQARAVVGLHVVAFVDVDPAHADRPLGSSSASSNLGDLDPDLLGVEEGQLLRASLLDQVILEDLARELIPVATAIALNRSSEVPLDLRLVIGDLNPEAAVLEELVCA